MRFSRPLTVAVVFSAVALAQVVNTGAVIGTVTDSSGAAMPGVVVTATSPALQGQVTFVTNEQGNYRFPTLPLGTYRVTFQSPGFSTMVHADVNVRLSFTDTIDVQMSPSAQKDTVTVLAETPLVDTQSATVLAGFNKQQLTDIPTGRDMWSIIGLTPGMHVATLDVGGSAVGNQVAYTSYGYGGQNRVMIDGINTSEGTSGAGFYFDYGSFQEFTVGAAANDASVPQPGNAINAVIRTGGNQFHGEMYVDYENPSFQSHNVSQDQILQGAGSGQRTAVYYDFNGNFGGPIKKDRVWFFTSLRDQANAKTVTGFPVPAPGTVNSYAYDRNATYKVSADLSTKHRLSQYIQWNPILKPQRNSAAGLYQDAMQYQKAVAWVGNLQYTGTITPRLVVNVLLGTWGYNFPLLNYGVFAGDPGTPTCPCAKNLPAVAVGERAPRMTELVSATTAGASAPTRSDPRRYQFEPSGSYFMDNFLHSNHQFKFGEVSERETEENQTYGSPNNLTETFNSKGPTGAALPDFSTPYQVTIANTPRVYTDVVMHHGAYLTDQVRIGKRLTLNIGARWDFYRSTYLPISLRTDCQFCPYFYQGVPLPNGASLPPIAVSGNFPGATVSRFPFLIAPRLAAVFDLTGKGKTVLRVNWGIYYNYPSTNISNAVDPLQSATAVFTWNNPNNLPFNLSQLGPIVGSPKIAQGSSVQPHLQDGRFDDMGAIVEHQLSNTLSIRGGFIFREVHHDFQTINLALPASLYTIPVQVKVPGPAFGLNGNTTDFQTMTLWDVPKNLIGPTQNQYSSPAGNNSVYRNLEFTINKRMSRRFTAVANFYWTHTTNGNAGVATDPNSLINNHQSYSDWTAHFDSTYRGPWGINISPVLRLQAGAPLARTYNVTGLNIGTYALQVEPLGTYRSQQLSVFDTRLEKQLRFRERIRLDMFFDAFNILNSNADNVQSNATSVKSTTINIPGNPANGQTVQYQGFLSPTTILPPRIFRIGARFSF